MLAYGHRGWCGWPTASVLAYDQRGLPTGIAPCRRVYVDVSTDKHRDSGTDIMPSLQAMLRGG